MRKLLFCWELGANFGHLSNIAAIQPDLKAQGFDIRFAVADLKAASEILGSAGLLQAPAWPHYTHRGSTVGTASFADVLTLIGFGQARHLSSVVDAWLALFDLVDPSVIIADHSPAAQIACRIAGHPLITMGTGFTMPPLDYPSLPPLRADIAPALPEAELLSVANSILVSHGAPAMRRLTDLLRSDARILIGLPELDPYGSFRRETFSAPVGGFAPPSAIPAQRRLFVYLGAELPDLLAKVQILCDLPIPVEFYIRGVDRMLVEFITLRGKTIHDKPAEVRSVLRRTSHVMSQAGAMMTSEALAAGRPQFLLPSHFEGHLNSAFIVRGGFGRDFQPSNLDPRAFRRDVTMFLDDRDAGERTLNFARVLATRPLPDAGSQLLETTERLAVS